MENTDGKNVKRFMCSSNDWDYKALCASICDYSESCERNRTRGKNILILRPYIYLFL